MRYASEEDEKELYCAMLVSPAWYFYLNRVVQPEVKRLRKQALTNANLGEIGHANTVRQLSTVKAVVFDAYKLADIEVPKELHSWFE